MYIKYFFEANSNALLQPSSLHDAIKPDWTCISKEEEKVCLVFKKIKIKYYRKPLRPVPSLQPKIKNLGCKKKKF